MAEAKADPSRPWKAIVAAVVAGAGVAIAQGQDILPAWVMLLLAVLVGGLGTFLVPNPIVNE
jgi:fatty acid desaturase